MHQHARARGWLLLSLLTPGACEQELALPDIERPPVDAAAGAVADGFTGTAGAPDAADCAEKLPILELPIASHSGGAGGAEGESGAAGEAVEPRDVARGGSFGSGASGGSAAGSASHEAEGGSGGVTGNESGSGGAADNEGGSGGAAEPIEPPRLLFSEYVEGSGNNKALEIFALAVSSLEGCELRIYWNGEAEGPKTLALHGSLAPGATHVLCSSTLALAHPTSCDRSTSLNFNGDDTLALVCNDVVLDVFGQIGADPGAAWGDGATVDHTLRRRCSVTEGLHDGLQPFDPATEWLLFPKDMFTGLGEHTCTATPSSP